MQKIEVEEFTSLTASNEEIAVIDVRYQEEFIRDQILASVSIPIDRLDIEVPFKLPNPSVLIVIIAGNEKEAIFATNKLSHLGYKNAKVLKGGIDAWKEQGKPTFQDVNAESKAFGEFIEHAYHTPNITPQELYENIKNGWDGVIIDCRPAKEHIFSHIPGAIHIPGGDIYQKLHKVVKNKDCHIVIHCGGRTRGIIAAQSIINAGICNPVRVLTNGTMGWHLCGYELEQGLNSIDVSCKSGPARGDFPSIDKQNFQVLKIEGLDITQINEMVAPEQGRTVYIFDLRPKDTLGVRNSVGQLVTAGQLIQATDEYVVVRGARIILADDDVLRAKITASWLRQMGWHETFVHIITPNSEKVLFPLIPMENTYSEVEQVEIGQLMDLRQKVRVTIIDVSQSHEYLAGHIPGAGYCPRHQLPQVVKDLQDQFEVFVLTSKNPKMSLAAANDMKTSEKKILVLKGGNEAWAETDVKLTIGAERLLGCTPWLNEEFGQAIEQKKSLIKNFVDWELERFFDPETTEHIEDAMKKYLNWEIDLVHEWKRDTSIKFNKLS
jgi:rhodanese-related sulfurtransferase